MLDTVSFTREQAVTLRAIVGYYIKAHTGPGSLPLNPDAYNKLEARWRAHLLAGLQNVPDIAASIDIQLDPSATPPTVQHKESLILGLVQAAMSDNLGKKTLSYLRSRLFVGEQYEYVLSQLNQETPKQCHRCNNTFNTSPGLIAYVEGLFFCLSCASSVYGQSFFIQCSHKGCNNGNRIGHHLLKRLLFTCSKHFRAERKKKKLNLNAFTSGANAPAVVTVASQTTSGADWVTIGAWSPPPPPVALDIESYFVGDDE